MPDKPLREEPVKNRMTRSSGNVFKDLGFPEEEAENLKIRSALMGHVRRIMDKRGLTQARAARLMGVSQPRVSDMVRGKIDLFSIDALVAMLAHLGARVRLEVISPSRRSHVA
ncbi:MAG TPA: XRE family transcriptional regulator [Verrucomicrobiae bacterium]|nr:XRE family transcriptional regulator [Verrucomicrobiae bacterium]